MIIKKDMLMTSGVQVYDLQSLEWNFLEKQYGFGYITIIFQTLDVPRK